MHTRTKGNDCRASFGFYFSTELCKKAKKLCKYRTFFLYYHGIKQRHHMDEYKEDKIENEK